LIAEIKRMCKLYNIVVIRRNLLKSKTKKKLEYFFTFLKLTEVLRCTFDRAPTNPHPTDFDL